MGGTCAVDLTVMHPELFSTFVDIAGDMGPNAGTKEQTIARIYGGDAAKWAIYDPTTVINKHGPYKGVSGWFAISSDAPMQRKGGYGNPSAVGLGGQDAAGNAQRSDAMPPTRCASSAGPTTSPAPWSPTAGPPRLAVGDGRLHVVAAVAGRPDRHARRPEDSAARRGRWAGTGGRSTAGRDALNRRVSADPG